MDKELKELIHRHELKHYLSEDELTLPDERREELLLQRKLVDEGFLSEMDLIINKESIQKVAKKSAATRNKFDFWVWMDTLPKWLQTVIVIIGIFILVIIFS